ncbi:hypothetical protein F8568_024570 [Actinomadura sp. LD22]|uniref:Uncharacterized protein n=1 Tax=Actinomadura physcomitrii TaxID=2650748 RepID=A0A6I4MHL5_9ACTN|nr:hypothetical protein [Actinomadura physcomitrii]MWA03497.1 hypothetical protein [Actinomadura physcomitrii]
MTDSHIAGGRARAAASADEDLAALLRAAGIDHPPGDPKPAAEARAMFRRCAERLARLDLGDTPPATVFAPWQR